METPKFEQYSLLKNTINKSFGIVIKAIGENITIRPVKGGERMTFKAQYLEPASQEEISNFKELIEQIKKEENEKPQKAPRRIIDPADIRYGFEKFLKHITVRYPKSGEGFKSLWNEILSVAGDFPGKTWEMKSGSTNNPCPVIKIFNPTTQKRVYCLNFMAGWGLRMEIKKEFLPQEFDGLFPIDNAMFGIGKAVEINYADFSPEKRRQYIDCVKAIYKSHPEPK